jgi:hypothetical protein
MKEESDQGPERHRSRATPLLSHSSFFILHPSSFLLPPFPSPPPFPSRLPTAIVKTQGSECIGWSLAGGPRAAISTPAGPQREESPGSEGRGDG